MIELTRTNDAVFLSWLPMRLEEEDGDAVVLDTYTAMAEGSICATQRRIMVADDDLARAHFVLQEATNL